MAIDAKQSFLSQLERKCADMLTVAEMPRVMSAISDLLQGFRMEELQRTDLDQDDDLLDAFIASMKVQGRSEKTIDRYVYVIGRFMAFAGVPTRAVNVYHIRKWITAEKGRGIQESTQEGERQVLSSYFGWLFREGLIEKNPMGNVGTIKVPKKQKKTFSPVEIRKLNDACSCVRNRAMIAFMASTGCRVSEMTGLNRDALDMANQECVVHGKGDKERTVYFDSVTAMLLDEYLKTRKDDNPALFIGKFKERITANGVRDMLTRTAERAGVENAHPHKFRRTRATEWARKGMQIQTISHLLGHTKLETTMQYVIQQNEDVKNDFRRYA